MSEASYTPRPGSKAEAAAIALQAAAGGELSTADLADEIDVESGTLHAVLSVPIKWGYLARERRDGITWWRMGDGTPAAAAAADGEPEAPPAEPPRRASRVKAVAPRMQPYQRRAQSTKRAAPAKTARPKPKPRAALVTVVSPPPSATAPLAAAPSLSCAVFNTGELLLEVPGQAPLRLDGRQTADLLRWLQRVQPTLATEAA